MYDANPRRDELQRAALLVKYETARIKAVAEKHARPEAH